MADISVELANIANAIKGEEVRGSIHDSIQKINLELEGGLAEMRDYNAALDAAIAAFDTRGNQTISDFEEWFEELEAYLAPDVEETLTNGLATQTQRITTLSNQFLPTVPIIHTPAYSGGGSLVNVTWTSSIQTLRIFGYTLHAGSSSIIPLNILTTENFQQIFPEFYARVVNSADPSQVNEINYRFFRMNGPTAFSRGKLTLRYVNNPREASLTYEGYGLPPTYVARDYIDISLLASDYASPWGPLNVDIYG